MNEELRVVITAEIGRLRQSMQQAQDAVHGFATSSNRSITSFQNGIKKANGVVMKGAKAVAEGIGAVGGALLGVGPLTSEYREAQAKLATAFETAGSSAEAAKSTYNDLYKVLGEGDVAVEAANHLAKLTNDEKALSEWTNICQGVYATFGDSLPIEGLTEAANETAKVGQVTGGLADALNWAGMEGQTFGVQLKDNIEFTKLSNKELEKMNEEEREQYELKKAQFEETEKYNEAVLSAASAEDYFNLALQACNSEAEREKLIRETLNGMYSEASAAYAENNEQILAQNEANRKMNDAMAALGETMAPINTMLTELGADILTQLTPYIKDFGDKYLPKVKEVLADVGDKIGICLTWIADHWNYITTIGGIILIISGAIVGVNAAMTAYNAVMAIAAAVTSPMTWTIMAVVAAVAALTAGVIWCYKNWDIVKEKVHNAVESMKTHVSNLKESVCEKFNAIKDGISNTINKAKDAVKGAIDKIKSFFKFEWSLPKIKLPHFSIKGEFSLNPPSIPHFGVSWYARGGVFDKPSLFPYGNGSIGGLGEAGAEAVVPLEKNLKWLDKLADMLNDRMGNNNMVLMVDDRVLGEVTVGAINGITRSTGTLPLVLR